MKFFVLIFVLLSFSPSVFAQDKLCDALSKESTYEGNSSFLMLEAGKEGWVFRTSTDYKTDFKVNSALNDRLTRLFVAFKKHNIEPVIALLPTRGMIHAEKIINTDFNYAEAIESYQKLVKKLNHIGYSVAEIKDFSSGQDFYYKVDHHWNAQGAKKMAQRVAEVIKNIPTFNTIQKEKFITEVEKKTKFADKFAHFVADTCKAPLFEESVNIYKTYKPDISDEDLFSDEAKPEIVLLGTSNSTSFPSYSNFEGALKEAMAVDVKNMSVSGGGVETAMLDYFNSGQFIKDKPKILIWEIPVYQNYKGSSLYRQLIPAVYGECRGQEIYTKSIDLKGKDFSVILPEGILAKNHYMVLDFSEAKERKYSLASYYNEGGEDKFNLRLSKYSQFLGKNFVEFDQAANKSIKEIKASFKNDVKGTLNFSICSYSSSE